MRILRVAVLLGATFSGVCCSGCAGYEAARSSQPRERAPDVAATHMKQLVAGQNEFALALYQQLREGNANIVCSPYSISVALAMVSAGARGETLKEIHTAARFRLDQTALHPAMNALESAVTRRSDGLTLHVANSLWCQQGYVFLPSFLDTLGRNYSAGVNLVDFGAPKAASRAINGWVSDQTQGHITEIVPVELFTSVPVSLAVVNAIYFDARWETEFQADSTRDGPFHRLDGTDITASMMHDFRQAEYARGDGYAALQLRYKGKHAAMLIILPDEGRFRAVEHKLAAGEIGTLPKSLSEKPVTVALPRFEFGSDFRLDDALSAMGMAGAFRPGADFSGMDGRRDLYLVAALHKATIQVYERGTVATAATGLVAGAGVDAGTPAFTADRPFIFLIRDIPTGTILFVGRVMDASS